VGTLDRVTVCALTWAERPDLAERGPRADAVWPEYNLHGDVFEDWWTPLLRELPEYQFALYDDAAHAVVAEAHTERYVTWRREDGELLDPWMRLHERLGARVATALPESMRITGTVGDWERWTQLALPDSGRYVFPYGLAPLAIDREADLGTYWEPNVWMVHPELAGG
jgi:hypothetical protein